MQPRRGRGLGDLHRHVRVSVHVHALGGVVVEHGSSGDCQRGENIESAVTSMNHIMAMRGAHTYMCVCVYAHHCDRSIYLSVYLSVFMYVFLDTSTHWTCTGVLRACNLQASGGQQERFNAPVAACSYHTATSSDLMSSLKKVPICHFTERQRQQHPLFSLILDMFTRCTC